MGKLFIFAIGGTGSRVIKALTMLLASGTKINASEIIPIIVDPHKGNKDLKRTIDLLNNYKEIRNKIQVNGESFFNTKISTLRDIISNTEELEDTFTFELKGLEDEKFKNYINHGNLDKSNKALASLLFSESNLETKMDIGFVGNPNIGSVVLNQFKESEEFKQMASNFSKDDAIFVVSSIFGGTGAAGFPIIIKNIRDVKGEDVESHVWLKNSRIGAISILPYFGVEPDKKSKISKTTFISKTKAALSYYGQNISGNKSLNALYYLGDDLSKNYKNDSGENGQQNNAHFIELVAALSIIDYMDTTFKNTKTTGGKANDTICKEFGILNNNEQVTFDNLGSKTKKKINQPLTQYMLFYNYLQYQITDTLKKGQPFINRTEPKINQDFFNNEFYKSYLNSFNKAFIGWMKEMNDNKRTFSPLRFDKKLNTLVNGLEAKKGWRKLSYSHFDSMLNAAERQKEYAEIEEKFMHIFYNATKRICEESFFKN